MLNISAKLDSTILSRHTPNFLVSAFICAAAFKIPSLYPISLLHMAHVGGNLLTVRSDVRESQVIYFVSY